MNIIEEQYNWAKELGTRYETNYIVLHHEAGYGTAQGIHRQHLGQGWSGIGYHIYVRIDGSIYRGRPIWAIGSHAYGFNYNSVGICAEGYYHPRTDGGRVDKVMPLLQKNSLIEVGRYVLNEYPNAKIVRHRDLMATACPGQYYPYDEIVNSIINYKNIEELLNMFNDFNNISEWAKDSVKKLEDLGILKGDENNNFNPKNGINREEVAVVLNRLLQLFGK